MKRTVAKLSDTRSEELHREREYLDSTEIVIRLKNIEREKVLKVLSLLDDALRRNPVEYEIDPPEGFVSTFYGFERDLWSKR